jgi:hypothetical protein
MQAVTYFLKSHRQHVQMFGAFECFVLKAHDLFVIHNVGRWCSLDNLELHLQEADEIA